VVLSRDVVTRVGTVRAISWIFSYGALLFAPIGVRPLAALVPELTARGWGLCVYILVVPTILSYSLNAWALSRSNASLVTAYIYLQPLFAGALAWIQLGLGVSQRAWLAAALICVGLGVVSTRNKASLQVAKANR
jgi:drug/metabolite transporter (DMT)-like permease